ncbi:MAG: hypothetical protein P0S94_03325 [Simkaniaceae bacterium]|nr:hypothetical protein [Simkaniaceae bacterium]
MNDVKRKLSEILKAIYRKKRSRNPRIYIYMRAVQYWEKIMTTIFNYPSRCYEKCPVHPKTLSNPVRELKYFSDRFGIYAISKSLICRISKEKEDIEIVSRLLKKIDERIKNDDLYEKLSAEIICKVLAYRNLEKGDIVSIPVLEGDERGIVKYRVDHTFDLWKQVVAFALLPESERGLPILLYRGTEFNIATKSGRATMLSDLDPEGPGHKMFNIARDEIHKWLRGPGKCNAIVMGHSLGGALANYTAIYEHDCISKTIPSYTFNAPGIDAPVVSVWDAIPDEKRPAISAYITQGDVVAKFGKLYATAYEVSAHKTLSPVIAHQTLAFTYPCTVIAPIDLEKENTSQSRLYYSKLQKHTTSWAYRFGLKHLLPKPNK